MPVRLLCSDKNDGLGSRAEAMQIQFHSSFRRCPQMLPDADSTSGASLPSYSKCTLKAPEPSEAIGIRCLAGTANMRQQTQERKH